MTYQWVRAVPTWKSGHTQGHLFHFCLPDWEDFILKAQEKVAGIRSKPVKAQVKEHYKGPMDKENGGDLKWKVGWVGESNGWKWEQL